jgi:ATP-dependent helicase/nuclease subunit B
MDPMGFGSLVHEALQALGNDRTLAESTEVDAVRSFLRSAVLGLARDRFGTHLSPALVAQVEAASQRLAAAAPVHVQSVLDGWRIHAVEKRLDIVDSVVGVKLSGRIDRIDRHQATGRYRILDYKTGDSPMRPDQAHLGTAREGSIPEALVEVDGKDKAWIDLQLPLYRALLADQLGTDVEVGYFLLPKAVSETRIELWSGLTPAMVVSALACARGITTRILAREFWPPTTAELEELYGAQPDDLDPEWLERLLGRSP